MRGGAQAFLLECSDGCRYVVKTRNNPQHRRILVNEWITSALMQHLSLKTPPAAIVDLSHEFLVANPEIEIRLASRVTLVDPGPHFGSQYAGESDQQIYDFIPDRLLDRVVNLTEFSGVLAFDKWIGNADARQAVFIRAPLPKCSSGGRGFEAIMIDHGHAFAGPYWRFCDSPRQGFYFRSEVYRNIGSLDDFEPWLGRIVHFSEEALLKARLEVPEQWLDGDESALDRLLDQLLGRCNRVPTLVVESIASGAFPNWSPEPNRNAGLSNRSQQRQNPFPD